jgi:putative ABC transport system permease protein
VVRAAIKGVFANKLRLTLTALAIVIGVGFVAATYIFTDTINSRFETLLTDINQGVDVIVRPEQPDFGFEIVSMPEGVLDTVAAVEGVAVADPAVNGFAQVVGTDGEPIGGQGPPTLGVSWTDVEAFNPTMQVGGRAPTGPGEVVIDVTTAETGNIAVGDRVTILSAMAPEEFEVVGTVSFGEDNALLGATLSGFELTEAQRVMDLEGRLTVISVQGDSDLSPEELQQRIGAVLPSGVESITGEADTDEQLDDVGSQLNFLTVALLAFAAVAVFVGAFIITNTFRIIVAQRTRELALLRAIGATGRQVVWMVAIEALVVAIVASVVGIGVGVLLAYVIAWLMSLGGFEIPLGSLTLLPRTVAIAMAVGLIVTLISSLLPARKAARVPPVAAMREETARPASRSLRNRAIWGSIILGIGILMLAAGLFVEVSNALAYVGLGALVTFVGVSVLLPLASKPIARVLGLPLPYLFGTAGQLAQENTRRKPRRTASTASALMIGIALVVFFAVFAESIKENIEESILNDFPADLSASSTNFIVGLSPTFAEEAGELAEVQIASALQFGAIRVEEPTGTTDTSAVGIEPGTILSVFNLETTPQDLQRLDQGGVLVDPDLMEDQGWVVGDTVIIEYASTGPQPTEIVGAAKGEAFGSSYWISTATYEENFASRTDFIVFMKFADGVAFADAEAAVRALAEGYANAEVQTGSEVVADAEAQINQILAFISGLLFLAIIIAVLGITNTLALSIIERTREIGLLRAVGMERRTVRRMIRWESVIIALFGAVVGILLGVVFGWAVVRSLADEGLSTFDIPWVQLISLVLLSGVVGIIAAIYPAWKASRLNILEAIAYE